MTNIILSAATFTAILLLYGAYRLSRRGGMGQQPLLMALAAVVIIVNLAIWTLPDKNGRSLATEAAERPE